jgi:hypothetical protein
MNPVTAIMAASAAAKAIGTLTSGLSKAGADRYNARVADENAEITAQQASLREDQIRRQGRQTIGEQIAATAQNSGGNFTGSALDTIRQSETNLSLDALNARYSGDVQVTDLNNQAAMYRQKGKADTWGGVFGAGASLLKDAATYGANGGFGSS